MSGSPFYLFNFLKERNLIKYKEISMMRGKSPPSEQVLEKIQSNSLLGFKEDLEREIISFYVKILITRIYSRIV